MYIYQLPVINTLLERVCYTNLMSIWMLLILNSFDGLDSLSSDEIESHLELGKQMVARGQYSDALSHYHAAVEADPKNYLTYFKRATVYLALGKSKPALEDLNQVIQLKPDFLSARLQRGGVLMKQGYLDEAHIDLEWVLRNDPYNEEATRLYTSIEPIKHDLQTAYMYYDDGAWPMAIDVITKLIHELPWDVKLREMRATCFENVADYFNAISDLRAATKLKVDNTDGYLKLSKLHYEIGDVEESLTTIRECLKLDPDHKNCWEHYKKVKKLAGHFKSMNDFSQTEQFAECVEKSNAALKVESGVTNIVQLIKKKSCHCLTKLDNPTKAIEVCTEALELDPNDAATLCDRADAYLNNDDYENAQSDYARAREIEPDLKRAQEGLKAVKGRQRQARDYYKILGVRRNANKKDILKAYRKLAQKWHPDNFQGDEKKSAEKKFIDIASAKEVLTDPEKRRKFDAGEDPLDPESQANQGFNGFNPFHFQNFGGKYTFTFG
ncbi:dnaJ homolog subfamily C member 3 [Tetranychus urticae]|uniref:J domain-containing protein n=1 Tax=Tetranychus urticae TaxID=32264 RepID=T1KPY4_TETUR|nr:dnaJ homolog subfamily C member 3 [Tetranychus urticae]